MLEVGYVRRPHGTGGDVRVTLTSERTGRLDPGAELSTGEQTLRVVSSRRHTKGWLVRFAGVDRREDAEALAGTVLYAPALDDDDDDTLWVHRIIGLTVVDTDGVGHGTITAVQANPAHDLLVLDDGTLVPSVFITEVADTVVVEVPEGLFG